MVTISDYEIMDKWLLDTFDNRVSSMDRRTVQEKRGGSGDNPLSDWDIIHCNGFLNTSWRFKSGEDLSFFVLTYSDMLVKYDYEIS